MAYTYKYPRPSVTVDIVVFGIDATFGLNVLLIERGPKDEAFPGRWAIPGGFVNVSDEGTQGESLEDAAYRELQEETGIKLTYLEQLYTFGTPGRDPRGRVISAAYMALVRSTDFHPVGGDDASDAKWFPLSKKLPPLAFDHGDVLATAKKRLTAKVRYEPVGFNLLPPTFSLGDLQRFYEGLLGRKLDAGNFRKRILKMGILTQVGIQKDVSHRPGKLYRFDKRAYDAAVKSGFNFEI